MPRYFEHKQTGKRYIVVAVDEAQNTMTLKGDHAQFDEPNDPVRFANMGYIEREGDPATDALLSGAAPKETPNVPAPPSPPPAPPAPIAPAAVGVPPVVPNAPADAPPPPPPPAPVAPPAPPPPPPAVGSAVAPPPPPPPPPGS